MLKKIAVLSSLLLGFITASGQESTSLLWKISGKGLKQPSYIFGTIHLICHDDYLWTPVMQQAFDASDKVAFEMDMDDPSLLTEIAQGMTSAGKTDDRKPFTEDEYKLLATYFKDKGLSEETIQESEPFALLSLLYMKMLQCSMPESYEGNIMKMAVGAGKEIVGLETVDEQLAVINNMNDDSLSTTVVDMVKNTEAFRQQYDQMLEIYKKQDLPALHRILLETPDYQGDLNVLLYERNAKWIKGITDLAKAQSTFMAVGAGHLWGEKGIIALLRKQGYKVEPLK